MGEQMEIAVNSIANEYYDPKDLPSYHAEKAQAVFIFSPQMQNPE